MTSSKIRRVTTRRSVGDPSPQKRTGRPVVRLLGSCALFVAAIASLMAGGVLALSSAAPAGASLPVITVNCPADSLVNAIYSAPAGSTIQVSGTCTGNSFGNFYIDKDLTVTGPAVLDGSANPATTLNVAAGNVVLNDITIQGGTGSFGLGGGLWNSGQLTLSHSTVTNNSAYSFGGVWNMGQLTLANSTVSHNTSTTYGPGGIYNCGVNPALNPYSFCLGTSPGVPRSSLTVSNSDVSNNVGGSGGTGGGIVSDAQTVMTITNSTVSNNTGGGIFNGGTATITNTTISNNVAGSSFGNSGGLSSTDTSTTTINNSTIQGNTAGGLAAGGIFAGGPMQVHNSIVTGNSASMAGGMLVWNGPTTVVNSSFSNNSDLGSPFPDTMPGGVLVAPANFFGPGSNNPTFTTTHSTYS